MNPGRRFALGALVLLALASLAVNVFLAGQLRSRYESQLVQQVWPAGLPQTDVASGTATNATPVVLFLGDSRVAAWPLPESPNQRLINAGIPGATTAQLRLRLPALLSEHRPKAVIIEAGINDLKLLGLRPQWSATVVAQAADNMSNMVAQCRQQGCQVLVLETWPTGRPELLRRFVWDRAVADSVPALNERLRALALPTGGVRVVDLLKAAGVAPGEKDFRDALHFRPAVYDRLTPALEQELKKLSEND